MKQANTPLAGVPGGTRDGSDEALDAYFQDLRAREFARLDAAGQVYLDHTGSALYPESLVDAHAELLRCGVLGNPHSKSPTSLASGTVVKRARERVARFFRADPREYDVVFTLNCSGALKLVGESYPFEPGSRLLLTTDNHNSVNGVREYAHARRAEVHYAPLDAELRLADLGPHLEGADPARPNLFIYPAQSNFSGVKHPLEWIELARAAGYDVMLDAAAYVPSNRLDLRRVRPDFVSVSFYKMFGYPTGIGALIARRAALARLHRPWFAGGTVRFASAQNDVHVLYRDAEAFEDGTLDFLGIAALPLGLDFLEGIGLERVSARGAALTEKLLDGLRGLQHGNGAPMVRFYGPLDTRARGGTVAFNLLDAEGGLIDCRVVEERAAAAGISFRTGRFCNPGAAEAAFDYMDEEAYRCFRAQDPDTFTLGEFSICMAGKPVGAVRASVGLPTNDADIGRLLGLLTAFRDLPSARLAGPVPAAASD